MFIYHFLFMTVDKNVVSIIKLYLPQSLITQLNFDVRLNNMKLLRIVPSNVFSLIILLLATVNEYECKATLSDMQAAEYACYKEMSIKKEEVPNLGNFYVLNEDTDNYRKMYRCLFIKMGVLDGQGNMNVQGFDNFVKLLSNSISTKDEIKNMATESLQQCKYIEGQTGGEIGLKFKNCLRNAGLDFHKKFALSV